MATRWCTELGVAKKRCPFVFKGHPSTFKCTRDKIWPILTKIWCFLTVTAVRIDSCVRSNALRDKAWSSVEEVPYYFSRSSIKIQGHTGDKIADFEPNWVFPDCNSSLNSPMVFEMMHEAWSSIKKLSCCFSRSSVKFQGHCGQKNRQFWPELSVSGLYLKFDFTDGFEMMHKALSSIEEGPYCFRGRPSNFEIIRA